MIKSEPGTARPIVRFPKAISILLICTLGWLDPAFGSTALDKGYISKVKPRKGVLIHLHGCSGLHVKGWIKGERARDAEPGDGLYYPLRRADDQKLLARYVALAKSSTGVTFLGRLGTHAYIDMDKAAERAIETAHSVMNTLQSGERPPPFVHDPLAPVQ